MGYWHFLWVTQVTKLVLRDGVTEIPESAFAELDYSDRCDHS